MANKLQILSNGESFDLFDGEAERFYITYQIHDLSNLQTRNGDFSRRVSLPLTAKNKGILGAALPTISRFDSVAVGTIPCDILVNDMPALSDAYFVIDTQEENAVTIQIFGGISKFYSDLPDSSIQLLDFSSLNFDWTIPNLDAITNTTSGVCYARAQWITNPDYNAFINNFPTMNNVLRAQQAIESGFFIYTKTVLEKIFEGFTNLTFDTSAMDAQFDRSAIACTMSKLHSAYINEQNISEGILVNKNLPNISQRNFVREVFKLYNIVAVESNNTVTLKYFDSLKTQTAQNIVLDSLEPKKIFTTYKTYAQTNELKYSDSDDVERVDTDSSFTVNSETLTESKVIIQSAFHACDVAASESDKTCIPAWRVEMYRSDITFQKSSGSTSFTTSENHDLNAGDMISVTGQSGNDLRRVVEITGDKSGVVDTAFTHSSNDNDWNYWRFESNDASLHFCSLEDYSTDWFFSYNGSGKIVTGNSKVAQFVDGLKWDNLKTTYYQFLVDALEKPFILQARINIPTISLLNLNPLAPVYVEDYNAYFYINKLEQWKLNTSCRVELIQIPI